MVLMLPAYLNMQTGTQSRINKMGDIKKVNRNVNHVKEMLWNYGFENLTAYIQEKRTSLCIPLC